MIQSNLSSHYAHFPLYGSLFISNLAVFNSAVKRQWEMCYQQSGILAKLKRMPFALTIMTLVRTAQKAWVRIQQSSNYYWTVGSCLMVKVNWGEEFFCQISGFVSLGTAMNDKIVCLNKGCPWCSLSLSWILFLRHRCAHCWCIMMHTNHKNRVIFLKWAGTQDCLETILSSLSEFWPIWGSWWPVQLPLTSGNTRNLSVNWEVLSHWFVGGLLSTFPSSGIQTF